jgi:acetyl esterase/lipase
MIGNSLKVFLILSSICLVSCSLEGEGIELNNPEKYILTKDLNWASPDGFDLTLDIYQPVSERKSHPVLIIFHGGGWLVNNKSIMDQMSEYLASNSQYVICNVNYRLLSDQSNSVTLNEIVEDAFGSVLWVKDNIEKYTGDPNRVAVTGDSAGAHLAAMIVNSPESITLKKDFKNNLGFVPTYLPAGQTIEDIIDNNLLSVQASILSYGAFDVYEGAKLGLESSKNPFWFFSGSLPRNVFGSDYNHLSHPEMYKILSPIYNIPEASEKSLPPQLLTVGSEDKLTTPESVKNYLQKLSSKNQYAEYWVHENRNHAFLDSGSNVFLGSSFENDAPEALDKMISFLDQVFKTK